MICYATNNPSLLSENRYFYLILKFDTVEKHDIIPIYYIIYYMYNLYCCNLYSIISYSYIIYILNRKFCNGANGISVVFSSKLWKKSIFINHSKTKTADRKPLFLLIVLCKLHRVNSILGKQRGNVKLS